MNKVFISYSRDSASHENFVLSLSAKLREDGIPTMLDKYVPYPDEGWTMWTEAQVRESNFVLLICTPTYLLRFREKETKYWIKLLFEGALITQLKRHEHNLIAIDQCDKPLRYMQRLSDLESNLTLLNKKKSKLEEQKIIEIHAGFKFNLEYLISEVDEECKKIEMEISHLNKSMKNISVLGNSCINTDFYFDEENQTRI
ncbi:MAG: TIR domain-containing protein, partial [Candidatus Electrothrix sp. AUS3]|nr:TIR domain-containing protein [Candidatus Electrothrix gigas]